MGGAHKVCSSTRYYTEKRPVLSVVKMARLLEMVRNSPLTKRRVSGGGYSVMESANKDPFVQGITFHAHYVCTCNVGTKHDSPEVQQKIKASWDEAHKVGKHHPKVTIIVKASSLRVKDASSKQVDDFPMYLVSYCGASTEADQLFYFIHKTKIDKVLHAEIFKFSSASKVTAVTLTVAKAFNIAFKAWVAERRRREREQNKTGLESPLVPRRQLKAGDTKPKEPSHIAKLAPGVAKYPGPFTPPAPRKAEEQPKQKRRGSFGDEPAAAAMKNPAVMRLRSDNEVTGSSHDVTLTGDFDEEFQELAESRSQPDILQTNLAQRPDAFNLEEIRQHVDVEERTAAEEPLVKID